MIVRKKLNKLPLKNFVIHFDKEKEEYYGVEVDEFTLPNRIYGNNFNDIDRWLKSFSILDKNLGILLSGYKGCVDSETEYFNGEEWKKISEYTEGEKVLQYNEDGTAELVTPSEYIKEEIDFFYHMKTKFGVNQMLSPEHRVIYLSKHKKIMEMAAEDLYSVVNKSKSGSSRKIITTFDYKHGNHFKVDENLLRLYIMIQADGHFPYKEAKRYKDLQVRVRLKRKDKKKRLENLLKLNKIEFNKKNINHQKGAKGFHNYTFRVSEYLENFPKKKTFPKEWYNLSKECLEVIYDELQYWDAYTPKGDRKYNYYTNNKQNAGFVQFLMSTLGYRAVISEDTRYKNTNYMVSHTSRIIPSLITGNNKGISKNYNHDGYKYCFTVPSGMLVLRRGGNINITGNSGKSLLAKQLMIEAKLPVLVIEEAFKGSKFNDFINSIDQEIVVFFDEFEKVYKEQEDQEELLTLFDGVISSKKIFLLTANKDNINEFFENRPSRIKYLKKFKTVDREALKEITDDLLKDNQHENGLVEIVDTLGECGKDLIISLIEEVNMTGETPLECAKRMNIKIPKARYDYVALLADGDKHQGVYHSHPLGQDSLRFCRWGDGFEYDEYTDAMKVEKYDGEIHMTDNSKNKFKFYKSEVYNALDNIN